MFDIIGALLIFGLLFVVVVFGLSRSERSVRTSVSSTRERDQNRTDGRADPMR